MGLLGLSCAGALPAASLRPDALGKGQGAFFGHIKVYNRHRNVTRDCHVAFTDERGEPKGHLVLDETGWVFASARVGATHLSNVTCTVGGFFKHVAGYSTRDFMFTVRGGNELVYFGDVVVEMHVGGKGATAAGIFGGGIAEVIVTRTQSRKGLLFVDDQFTEGLREYRTRYGQGARLVPRNALEPEPPVPSKSARASGASNALRGQGPLQVLASIPGGGTARAFDRKAASRVAERAAIVAATCQEPSAPHGNGKVRLTFSPSGKPISVVFGSPFANSSLEPCLARAFGSAKVPPYSGSSVTVSKRFNIP